MKAKTYILMKDLPDSKVGDEYIWVDYHEAYYLNGDTNKSYWIDKCVENNPTWFKLKEEERLKVAVVGSGLSGDCLTVKVWPFKREEAIFKEKHVAIQKAIEDILNEEPEPTPQNIKEEKPEWEMLSYEFNNRVYIPNTEPYIELSKGFKDKEYSIHSVKRLSDGEVFSLGDRVYFNNGITRGISWAIDNFYIRADNVMLARSKDNINVELVGKNLHKEKLPPKEEKPVLHTTIDGKEIKEYDSFYYIGDAFNICETALLPNEKWDNKKLKTFYYIENAKSFILKNKPCLSINDIETVCNERGAERIIWAFEELAKNKLRK